MDGGMKVLFCDNKIPSHELAGRGAEGSKRRGQDQMQVQRCEVENKHLLHRYRFKSHSRQKTSRAAPFTRFKPVLIIN